MTTIAESPRNERTQRPKRIELAIAPGRSLGPFRLGKKEQHFILSVIQHLFIPIPGSTLWDTIQYLRDRPQFFPSVELKYSQEVNGHLIYLVMGHAKVTGVVVSIGPSQV